MRRALTTAARPSRRPWLVALALVAALPAFADDVTPPEVLERVDATLPANAPPPKQDHVLLEFTVGTDGRATEILVVESAGEAWDRAASGALAKWRFKPARHEGVEVPARTRLSFTMPAALMAVDAGPAEAAPPDAGPPAPQAEVADGGADEDGGAPLFTADDAVDAGHPRHEMSTTVLGRSQPKSRGASDFSLEVGELQAVPRRTAADFLKLAPGILLTNEGGEGHPEQIFLRGFDAREGQDLELTVDGVPINELGNLHGNGFADLNFIIPELVENLRVLEGPFDPRQGNFAVAGSADYQLGLAERGLTVKGTYGSFDTARLVALWGPPGETSRTFGGVQLFRTSGFGQNRDAQNAKAAAQYEGTLSEHTSFRVGAQGYAAHYRSAGLLRADDVSAGRVGFYDTYDSRQGGDSLRAQVQADLHGHHASLAWDQSVFFVFRSTRILENFTGFLEDPQLPQQNPHPQRGDLIDRDTSGFTVGARGSARWRTRLFDRAQEVEAGYFFRFDSVDALQLRVEAGGNVPYRREYDLSSKLSDIGAYVDVNFSPVWWLALRGGLRAEVLTYDVLDDCAAQEVRRPSASDPPGDASCLSQRDFGKYRDPSERNSTSGATLMPRATLLLGPFKNVTVTGSVGTGVRSVDPQFITQNLDTPFASILAWEGGASWADRFGGHDVSARGAVFGTRVDKDLVFNPQAGRATVGGSTTRVGTLLAARGRGSFYDVSGNFTWVHSQFDDTGLLVPYVPDVVLRADGALFHALPFFRPLGTPLMGRLGAGMTWVGRRALPYGQRSDVIFVTDLNVELGWRWASLGLAITNLFGSQYRLGEYNYASDFRTAGSTPTLVPARHFSAGAPRAVMLTLAFHLGGEP
jgi:iron complex outermembrane receptor protein